VVCLTSPDLVFRALQARAGLADAEPRDPRAPVPGPRARWSPVVDGHPHTLAFLAGVHGAPIACLGVSQFGQSGDIADLYRHHGVDAETIVGAALDLTLMSTPAYTRLENDERRRRLLELGTRLFTEHAYDEISMAQIAREAGISKALLYHYFPSKQDYFMATLGGRSRGAARADRARPRVAAGAGADRGPRCVTWRGSRTTPTPTPSSSAAPRACPR
jgi:hypothetical protein